MDRDEYEDYLVDKAKELLHESDDNEEITQDNRRKRHKANKEVAGQKQDVDDAKENMTRMRKEADMLAHQRQGMDNDDLEDFLSGDSEFHDLMDAANRPNFTDWETRMILTNPDASPDELAEQLDRSVQDVKLQLKVLGLDR